jgi:hypothetical protein
MTTRTETAARIYTYNFCDADCIIRPRLSTRTEIAREACFQGGHPLAEHFIDAHRGDDGAYRNPGAGKPGGGLQAFIDHVEAMDEPAFRRCIEEWRDAIYGEEP